MNLHFGKQNWFSMGFFKPGKKQQSQINFRLDVDCGPQGLPSVSGLTDGHRTKSSWAGVQTEDSGLVMSSLPWRNPGYHFLRVRKSSWMHCQYFNLRMAKAEWTRSFHKFYAQPRQWLSAITYILLFYVSCRPPGLENSGATLSSHFLLSLKSNLSPRLLIWNRPWIYPYLY